MAHRKHGSLGDDEPLWCGPRSVLAATPSCERAVSSRSPPFVQARSKEVGIGLRRLPVAEAGLWQIHEQVAQYPVVAVCRS